MRNAKAICEKFMNEQKTNEDAMFGLLCDFITKNGMQLDLASFLSQIEEKSTQNMMENVSFKEKLEEITQQEGLSPEQENAGEGKFVIFAGFLDGEPCFWSNMDGWSTLNMLQEYDLYESNTNPMIPHLPAGTSMQPPKYIAFEEAKQM